MTDFNALLLAAVLIGLLIKTGELFGEIIAAIIKGFYSVLKARVCLFMKKKDFKIADAKQFFKEKYSLLSSSEIAALMKTKENSSWEEWYEALQSYADSLGDDWERSFITDCGDGCWHEAYNSGCDVKTAFVDGFTE